MSVRGVRIPETYRSGPVSCRGRSPSRVRVRAVGSQGSWEQDGTHGWKDPWTGEVVRVSTVVSQKVRETGDKGDRVEEETGETGGRRRILLLGH